VGLLRLSLLQEITTSEFVLVYSNILVSTCLLHRERLMNQNKFIRWLLTFTAIYFTIHVLIGLARGTI
jgi:hypothetical protein